MMCRCMSTKNTSSGAMASSSVGKTTVKSVGYWLTAAKTPVVTV